MNFAGAIIDEDDKSEWQIVHDRLCDCSSDRDKLAFRVFANVARGDCKRPYFWTTGKSSRVSYINEYK